MDRKTAPLIKDAVDFNLQLKPYDYMELANGVPVYMIDAGEQEVIQIEFVFYAGNSYEKQQSVAATTNYMLKNGTKNKTAFQLNEAFEYYGAYCNRACYNETAVVSLSTLSKHIPVLLPLVKEMITESVFPEEELAIYKQNSKQRLSVNLTKSDFVASRMIDVYIYGDQHPYGRYTDAEALDALTTAQLKAFYEAHYLGGQCILFVSGKLPADIRQQLDQHFGGLALRKKEKDPPVFASQPAAEKKYRLSVDPNGVQSSIRMARPFPNRHHPDHAKVMVLNTVFGGFFGSRLMSNIREDKGYTYGIHSYLQNHLQETAWLISTEAGTDVTNATIEEVYKEMQLLREELIDEEELALVRNFLIGTILGDLDGPFQIMGRWKNLILNGLDEKYFYNAVHIVKTISAEELRELAQRYLKPEDFYELVAV